MHPILFSIGFVTIYSFGTMIAVGYLLAGSLLWREARRKKKDPAILLDLGIGVMLSALLGGRALYIILNLGDYLKDPLEAFKIQHGGLVFYGGLLGAIFFALLFIKRKGLPLWETLDEMTPYATLVHAFGRIGCFLNGCCYGRPTSLFWGVTFPGHKFPLHPTQLYESFFLIVLFFVLRNFARKKTAFSGGIFLLYLFCYGLFRFIVEFFRGDQEIMPPGLTLPQVLSALLVGVSLFFWKKRKAA